MKIEIRNIKKVEDLVFESDNCSFILAKGMNRIGKTTFSQALRSVITLESIKNAVTEGKEEGSVTYTGKTVDGNDVVIEWITKDDTDKFRATVVINERIMSITGKKDIRQLTGNFFKYSSDDIFNMLSNEAGKKKFIKEFILTFLSEEQFKEYERLTALLSNSPKDTNSLYNQRTDVNRRLKDLESLLSKNITIKYDEATFNMVEKAIEVLSKVDQLRNQYTREFGAVETAANEIAGKLRFLDKSIQSGNIDPLIDKINRLVSNHYSEYFDKLKDYGVNLKAQVEERFKGQSKEELEALKLELLSVRNLETQFDSQRSQYKLLDERSNLLNTQIAETRESLSEVLKMANLPKGLELIENEIILNGKPFSYDSTSDSEARLMITEMLCLINTSKFVDVGDVTIFDTNSKKELLEIAKKHDCILIGQQVTDTPELNIECFITN